jgi:hypothetical protein
MSLGATYANVTALVVRHGLTLTGIGLAIGVGASLGPGGFSKQPFMASTRAIPQLSPPSAPY